MRTSKTPRQKRPAPERTEPNRTWASDAKPPKNGKAASAGPPPSDAKNPRSSAYRALNDAYRLVDEYLRQGQKMAENIWLPDGVGGAGGGPAFGAPERFMRAVGDMTLAWVEVMQQWTSAQGAPQAKPAGSAGPFSAGSARETHAAPVAKAEAQTLTRRELTVSVVAKGKVEVSLQLGEHVDVAGLEATELRPAKGKAPAIKAVSLSVDDVRAVLRVVVPNEQPRGTYNGLLVEAESQKPRGTVSLIVG